MKKNIPIAMAFALAIIISSPIGIKHSEAGFSLAPSQVIAEEQGFEDKMIQLEDRMHLLKMVIKRLKKSFIKAKKDHKFMVENGMAEKDIERLEGAFKAKLQKMINEAITEISAI